MYLKINESIIQLCFVLSYFGVLSSVGSVYHFIPNMGKSMTNIFVWVGKFRLNQLSLAEKKFAKNSVCTYHGIRVLHMTVTGQRIHCVWYMCRVLRWNCIMCCANQLKSGDLKLSDINRITKQIDEHETFNVLTDLHNHSRLMMRILPMMNRSLFLMSPTTVA